LLTVKSVKIKLLQESSNFDRPKRSSDNNSVTQSDMRKMQKISDRNRNGWSSVRRAGNCDTFQRIVISDTCRTSAAKEEKKTKKKSNRNENKIRKRSRAMTLAFLSKCQEIKNGGWIPEPLYI